MQRLYPDPSVSDVDDLYGGLTLDAGTVRAHVAVGMVASLDGAVTVDGTSGSLGGDADRVAFRRLRDAADAILVGAGTVRDEDYGPARASAERRADRRRRGLADTPTLVIVSGTLGLEPGQRVFADPSSRPVVVTTRRADERRRRALELVADVEVVGDEAVDLAGMLTVLADRGLRRVVCEGGPRLNGSLLAGDLVDELFVTLAPLMVAGHAPRLAHGAGQTAPRIFELVSLHVHDDEVLLRYRRRPDAATGDEG
jgi:riboflavin-specific deaminase-like protein